MLEQIKEFIYGPEFFSWHGLVLALCWVVGSFLGILSRRISIYLHIFFFAVIDYVSLFFIVGAMMRVLPKIGSFMDWSLIKQGHVLGGMLFLVLMVIQHVGGIATHWKGIKSNPSHRKLGLIVSNFGRVLTVFGFLLAQQFEAAKYAAILSAIFMVINVYVVLFCRNAELKPKSASSGKAERSKSPKRD